MTDSRPYLLVPLLLLLVSACSSGEEAEIPLFTAPETQVSYETRIEGLPNDDMTALAQTALASFRRQEEGTQSIPFLKRRANSDIDILQRLLRSRGYYNGTASVEVVQGAEVDGKETAEVSFTVVPGEPFTLADHLMPVTGRGQVPSLSAGEFGSPLGAPAAAAGIVDAETRALTFLKDSGFPYAAKEKRRAVADLEAETLEVTSPFDAGPLSVFGPIVFEGLADVEEAYLRTYLDWEAGETFSLDKLEDYQSDLLSTDLFASISVLPPEEAPEGAAPVPLPVTVRAEEREFRTVSAGLRFNTDRG
ncbi:MAG: hypothetical protein AAF908_07660, partial [Pseudomonadota bacterium]